MTKQILKITLAAAALVIPAFGMQAEKTKSVLDLKTDITDSNIIFPESYELDTQKMFEGWYMKNYTATDDRYKRQGDVHVSDDVIRGRLAKLNTVIEMPFNQIVRSYIDRYTEKGRAGVAAMLGLGIYYMPIFEQALEEEGLPLELKYLPVIESGLNPNAVSKHGATGLWQFMLATGKGLDLEVNSLVDERRDPYRSSKMAAKYLHKLYDTYGDWTLAIAAYNCGSGTLNKAIRRAGGDPASHDFWSVYYYLPQETRGYVPMFIAVNYVMNYYQYHNISPVLATKPLVTDTLMVSDRVHFNQISHVLDIPVDELRVLNPQFRADIIPGNADRQYTLVLPSQQVHAYIMSEDAILAFEADKYARRIDAEPGDMPADAVAAVVDEETAIDTTPFEPVAQAQPQPQPVKKPANTSNAAASPATAKNTVNTAAKNPASPAAKKETIHKVEPGETLSGIALKYNVTVADIKAWNDLDRNSVRIGQKLRINPAAKGAPAAAVAKNQPAKNQPAPQAKDNTAKKDNNVAKNEPAKKNGRQQEQTGTKGKNQGKADSKNNGKNGKKNVEPKQPSEHSVKNGENLSVIAKKYGTTVEEIKKANNLKGDKLMPGDNLKLPKKGKAGNSGKGASNNSGKGGKKKK